MSSRDHRRRGESSFKGGGFNSSTAPRSSSNSSYERKRYAPAKTNSRQRFKSSSRSMSKSSSEYGYRSESISVSNSRSSSRSRPRSRSRQVQRKSTERGRSKERARRNYESSPEEFNDFHYHRQHYNHQRQDERDFPYSRRSQKLRSVSSSGDRLENRARAHERSEFKYPRSHVKNHSRTTTTHRAGDEDYEFNNITAYSYSKSVPGSINSSTSRSRSPSIGMNISENKNNGRNEIRDKARQRDRDFDKDWIRSKSRSVSRSRHSSRSKHMSESQNKYKSNARTRSYSCSDEEHMSNSNTKTSRNRSQYYRNENSHDQGYDNDYAFNKNSEYGNRPSHGYNYDHGNSHYNDYDRDSYYHRDRNWKNIRYFNRYRDRYDNYVSRSFSEERERSRERERRRRKMQAKCIKKAGGFQKLAQSEGKEPTPVFYDGFQWVAKTGSTASMDPATMNNTRKFRRLYFGNLPINLGLTESSFQQIVWQEMALRGLCLNPNENPILCVWFAQKKGNYGFIEFRTVEETEKALQLDGFACMGSKIKVSRPNDYSQALQSSSSSAAVGGSGTSNQSPYNSASNSITALNSQKTINGPITKDNAFYLGQETALQLIFTLEDTYSLGTRNLDSKVLRITNVLDSSQIQNPQEYQEIKKNFCDGIQNKDSIVSSKIITIDEISRLCQELAEKDIQLEPADILLEFDSNANLQLSATAMSISNYNNKIPKMNFFNEDFYHSHLKG
ncbi:RNA recognition motif domain containing protein [Cryptosporidium meleagridis]